MMDLDRVQIDETIQRETLRELQAYCNDCNLSVDEFLQVVLKSLNKRTKIEGFYLSESASAELIRKTADYNREHPGKEISLQKMAEIALGAGIHAITLLDIE